MFDAASSSFSLLGKHDWHAVQRHKVPRVDPNQSSPTKRSELPEFLLQNATIGISLAAGGIEIQDS
jgi:hypothetical protein